MTVRSGVLSLAAALLVLIGNPTGASIKSASADPAHAQITVLYDAFGEDSAMQKDWGYAALVEYGRVADLRSAGSSQHTRSIPATTKERWVPRPCGSCKGAGFSCLTPYHGWFTKAARYDSLLVIQSICERDRQEPRHSRRNPCFSRDASANPNPFRLPRGRRNARGFPARVSHGHA
jgi:hypothetical protein